MKNPTCLRFPLNTQGNDYIVGDVHGNFTKLYAELKRIGFNEEVDRLFGVGDLVGRGPESDEVCELLAKKYFNSTLGNHEMMCVDYNQGFGDSENMASNGESWFLGMTSAERQYYVDAFECMPILIEIETPNGDVGIVHAECNHKRWDSFKRELDNPLTRSQRAMQAIWWRDRIETGFAGNIDGIMALVVGHSVVPSKTVLGNVHYIDTGSGFRDGHLTIINAHTLAVV